MSAALLNKKKKEKITEDKSPALKNFDLGDASYKTTLSRKYLNRPKFIPEDPFSITAFIPGTVGEVFVKMGDIVKKGDKLMVLDAMKMNNELLAPVDGTISHLDAVSGNNVPKNFVLISIKPDDEEQ